MTEPRALLRDDDDLLYAEGGTVAHLVRAAVLGVREALCGFVAAEWFGTGSQAEYDRARALRLCRACAARLRGPLSAPQTGQNDPGRAFTRGSP